MLILEKIDTFWSGVGECSLSESRIDADFTDYADFDIFGVLNGFGKLLILSWVSTSFQPNLLLCHAKVDRYKDREHSLLLQQERHKASENQIIYSSFGT